MEGAGVGRGLKAGLHEGNKGRDMGWDNPTMGEGLGRGNGSWRGHDPGMVQLNRSL